MRLSRAAPRHGDVARIDVSVLAIGTTSCTFRYDVAREKDGVSVATVTHTCVMSQLGTAFGKVPLPEDVRAVLETYRAPPER